jgi:hypothetical protein
MILCLAFVAIVAAHNFEEGNKKEASKRNDAFFKKIESFKF